MILEIHENGEKIFYTKNTTSTEAYQEVREFISTYYTKKYNEEELVIKETKVVGIATKDGLTIFE